MCKPELISTLPRCVNELIQHSIVDLSISILYMPSIFQLGRFPLILPSHRSTSRNYAVSAREYVVTFTTARDSVSKKPHPPCVHCLSPKVSPLPSLDLFRDTTHQTLTISPPSPKQEDQVQRRR